MDERRTASITATRVTLRALLSGISVLALAMAPIQARADEFVDGGQTVSVPGDQNSPWNVVGDLFVGNTNAGTLFVENGGEVNNAIGRIGNNGGSVGVVTVGGAGSTWTNTTLIVGVAGSGTLLIENGAMVTNALSAGVGTAAGGTGAVTVNNATWTNSSSLTVGSIGTGTVLVENGGAVSNTSASIATSAGTGTVNVTGPGSVWTNSSSLTVGENGTGALNISGGGAVSNTTAHIGNDAGSIGTATVSGAVSTWTSTADFFVGLFGAGTLNIENGGLVSNAASSIIASDVGSTGMVTVSGAGSTWTTGNALVIGNSAAGLLRISNDSAVSAQNVVIASQATSVAMLRIGGDITPVAAGMLNTPTVQFGAGTGRIDFNHTDTGYIFASDMLGNGQITHRAGVSNLIGDSSNFTGTTDITGGSLYVNGLLGGTTNVDGGTLGGSGALAIINVNSGGNVAPGNSIGTLNVTNITFNAGSTYTVELNDGGFVAGTNNDLINVTGTAIINDGNVHVTPENGVFGGNYMPGTYRILTATLGVTNNFATVTDDYAFLSFALSSDVNNIYLTSSAEPSFCLAGMSANQCAAGGGVLSLGSGALYNAVLGLSNAEAPGAFDQISGEVHASAKTALIEDSRFAREAAMDRLRIALGGVAGNGTQAEERINDGFSFWGRGFDSWGNWTGDGNAAAMGRSTGGFLLGGDAPVTDDIRLGLMGGYSHSSFSINDRNSSGTTDTYTLGAYAGGTWDAFSLKGGLAHSWHKIDTSRSVAFTGFSDNLSASYNARTFQAFGEAGYDIEAGPARFEPFASLAHVNLSTDGYAGTGGAAALTAGNQSMGVTFTTIGLRAQTKVDLGGTTANLTGMAGWRHAFGDVVPMTTHALAGGTAFTVSGVPIAKDAFVLELGASVNLTKDATLGFSYNGQFGSGFTNQGLKANLAVRF